MNAETKKSILEAIRGCKEDEKEDVKLLAVHALSLFEEASEESAADLIKLVIDGDKRQRGAAQTALTAMGERVVPDVISGLIKSDDWSARVCGVHVLTEIYMESKKQDALHGVKDTPTEAKVPLHEALKELVKEAVREMQHGC